MLHYAGVRDEELEITNQRYEGARVQSPPCITAEPEFLVVDCRSW